MVFYYYKVGNDEYCLTKPEHEFVLAKMREGKSVIPLRQGNLVLNMAYFKVCEVDKESLEREMALKTPRLNSGKNESINYHQKPSAEAMERVKKIRLELCKKMGWSTEWANKNI